MERLKLARAGQIALGLSVLLILLAAPILPAVASSVANGAIGGLVTCEGSPVASVVISIIPSGATDPIWTGMTQADGRYFTDWILPPGAYTVRNYYNLGVCQYAEVTKPATVLSSQTTTIDFAGSSCRDIVRNGGFEAFDVWKVGSTPWPARYATEQHHAGVWSMRSGILSSEPDRVSESSLYQAIAVPSDAGAVTLGFWYLPFTQEPLPAAPPDWQALSWAGYAPSKSFADTAEAASAPTTDVSSWAAYDWQEVLILDQSYRLLEVLQRGLSNAGAGGWQYRSYDLTPYRGRTVYIYFNTYNNGYGAKRTWMYVDDVAVRVCNQPPACTFTPTSQWVNLYGLQSTIRFNPLQPNQIVRAYDQAGVLAGCFVVRSAGRYGAMPVYADDPVTPTDEGLTPGETIRFTVDGLPATPLGPDAPTWSENGALLHVELDVGSAITRTITLYSGWNLISFDVMPSDNRTGTVLAPIAGKFSRVLGSTCTAGALSYYPTLPPEMNTLRTLDPYHGYWIYMTQSAQLAVAGPEVPDATPIALCPRWNLVGYLPDVTMPVLTALNSIQHNFQIVLGYDRGALSFYPDLPIEMNTLQNMSPTFGYWIRMTVTDTLTYPSVVPLAMAAQSLPPQRDDRADDIIPTYRWADAYSLDAQLNGQPVPAGAVIEAFDPNGVKIGHCVVKQAGRFGPMPLYGDDLTTPEDEGARAGDRITFTINGQLAKPASGLAIWRGERQLIKFDLRTRVQ